MYDCNAYNNGHRLEARLPSELHEYSYIDDDDSNWPLPEYATVKETSTCTENFAIYQSPAYRANEAVVLEENATAANDAAYINTCMSSTLSKSGERDDVNDATWQRHTEREVIPVTPLESSQQQEIDREIDREESAVRYVKHTINS